MIDRILLKDRLSMIKDYCRELDSLKKLPQKEFLEETVG